jgi:hypothetical protein
MLCRALGSLERIADTGAGDLPYCLNALAACRAAQGRTAEADSLFRLSTPRAWTSAKLVPAAQRIARARALRFYESQDRADIIGDIKLIWIFRSAAEVLLKKGLPPIGHCGALFRPDGQALGDANNLLGERAGG